MEVYKKLLLNSNLKNVNIITDDIVDDISNSRDNLEWLIKNVYLVNIDYAFKIYRQKYAGSYDYSFEQEVVEHYLNEKKHIDKFDRDKNPELLVSIIMDSIPLDIMLDDRVWLRDIFKANHYTINLISNNLKKVLTESTMLAELLLESGKLDLNSIDNKMVDFSNDEKNIEMFRQYNVNIFKIPDFRKNECFLTGVVDDLKKSQETGQWSLNWGQIISVLSSVGDIFYKLNSPPQLREDIYKLGAYTDDMNEDEALIAFNARKELVKEYSATNLLQNPIMTLLLKNGEFLFHENKLWNEIYLFYTDLYKRAKENYSEIRILRTNEINIWHRIIENKVEQCPNIARWITEKKKNKEWDISSGRDEKLLYDLLIRNLDEANILITEYILNKEIPINEIKYKMKKF